MKDLIKKLLSEETKMNEKWSEKYKKSIDCNNPKGFSQRAHCQGRKKKLKETHDENIDNYMFFSNLEQMKEQIENMLSMDKMMVDQILNDGHSWAVDHIATSKDDVEEVYNFLNRYK
jgi:hypothetical protein